MQKNRCQSLLPILLLTVLAMPGCKQPLDQATAEQAIAASEFLRETATTKLTLHRNAVLPPQQLRLERPELARFEQMGLVAIQPGLAVAQGVGIGAETVLTPAGERASAEGWRKSSGEGGQPAWLIPTATKSLVAVMEPTTTGSWAECAFTWKWTPTKMGTELAFDSATRRATARFRKDDEGWQLEDIQTE